HCATQAANAFRQILHPPAPPPAGAGAGALCGHRIADRFCGDGPVDRRGHDRRRGVDDAGAPLAEWTRPPARGSRRDRRRLHRDTAWAGSRTASCRRHVHDKNRMVGVRQHAHAVRMNAKAALTESRRDRLDHARDLLDQREHAPTLDALAREVGLSPAWLQRSFRKRFGVSPAEYARARRFDDLKQALRQGSDVTDAVYAAGFGSGSRVYEHSDRLLGMPPARYRDGGAGIAIRYTTVASPLGRVLVAATARGLCAVTLGDDDHVLLGALRREFPQAELARVDAGRDEWLAAVVARVARQFNGGTGIAAAGHHRHRVPVARVGSADPHSRGRNPQLRRDCPRGGRTPRRACGGTRLRRQQAGTDRALPSRRARRRHARRLALGRGAQANPAGTGTPRRRALSSIQHYLSKLS